ncbi:MAG: NAD(P)H-binding protein [Candidatus Obscuribacterales bacterium]|nr:NAD(P)H-binding protein [Candidatus Obscuribacterales bacterium]
MILIVGGTGLVGSRVTELLIAQKQHQLRVLCRGNSAWDKSRLPDFRRSGVDVIVGDVNNLKYLEKALDGCKAIINCSGVMRTNDADEIHAVNVRGVENLLKLGKEKGVQRFIQVSCVGATELATNEYFQSKWQAEDLVRNSSLYWTIFRTSLIFGPGSHLSNVLDYWVGRAPFVVVVGSGLNKLQPVSADDVAQCVTQSIYAKDTVGQSYELVGPESLDLKEMLTRTAQVNGRSTATIRIPSFLGIKLAAMFGKINAASPLDGEVMSVLTSEMVGEAADMTENFEVEALPFSSTFKSISSDKRRPRPKVETTAVPEESDDDEGAEDDEK